MREKTKKMRAGIQSHDFLEFLDLIDEETLRHPDARVEYWSKEPPFRAVVEWDERWCEPETIQDEYELAGLACTCADCPHLERGKHRTKKKWPCKYSKYGITMVTSPACERFYEELAAGKIKMVGEEVDA